MTLGAGLLDAKQVEVLRGPQGTGMGANGMAGLINIQANEPTDTLEGYLDLTAAQYNTQNVAGAIGGPINDKVSYRLAAQHNSSDGFITNDYLDRKNTNNIDETLLRTKLRIAATEDLDIDLTAFYANIDNGYDAFSLDNTRHTLADQPGHDKQETIALSGNSSWYGYEAVTLETALNINKSHLEYGYDVDWAYPDLHPANQVNNATDNYRRKEHSGSADIRLISTEKSALFGDSTDWQAGIYYYQRQSDLVRDYTRNDGPFSSRYKTQRLATYGELSTALTDKLTWINGLRLEQDRTLYSESDSEHHQPTEHLWGGRVALEYHTSDQQMLYGLIGRSNKVGGYNANNTLPKELRAFDSETLWNYELGAKHHLLDERLTTQIALFYQQRDHAQLNASRSDQGVSFDYIDNAERADSYGLEAQAQWQALDTMRLHASLGLLHTRLKQAGASFDGRDAAHAPEYQFALGVDFDHGRGWFSGLDIEGKDGFYFSDSHNASANAYTLLNARVGYQQDNWRVTVWGKNLTDQTYAVRGFEFGNDPRNGYATEQYVQLGAPRMLGVSTRFMF